MRDLTIKQAGARIKKMFPNVSTRVSIEGWNFHEIEIGFEVKKSIYVADHKPNHFYANHFYGNTFREIFKEIEEAEQKKI